MNGGNQGARSTEIRCVQTCNELLNKFCEGIISIFINVIDWPVITNDVTQDDVPG